MKITVAAALLAAGSLSTAAEAKLLKFEITGDYSAVFNLDSKPTPNREGLGGTTFQSVSGSFQGLNPGALADITFYEPGAGGGLDINPAGSSNLLLFAFGPQVFGGTTEAPMFSTGVFALTQGNGTNAYTLTISNALAGVPEPATWALMILGFGAVGGAMRRRQSVKVSYSI